MTVQDYKLFTIAIPTYNRCERLEMNLRAALPQVEKHKDKVRIYVSDNHSPDATEKIVKKYQTHYPDCLFYFRQSKNIGGHPNFYHSANAVNSTFICLMGDDDILGPHYIDDILQLIEEHPDLGLINVNLVKMNYEGKMFGIRDNNYSEGPKLYASGKEFIKEHLEVPSLMSSNVFRRAEFLYCLGKIDKEAYPGYDWFYAMYLSILDKPCLYVGFPEMITQENGDRWAKLAPHYTIFGYGHIFSDLEQFIPKIKSAWDNRLIKERNIKYLMNIISHNKSFYKEHNEEMLRYSSPIVRKAFRLAIYTPSCMFSIVFDLLSKIYLAIK